MMIAVAAQSHLTRPRVLPILNRSKPRAVIERRSRGDPPRPVPVRPAPFHARFRGHRVAVHPEDRIRKDEPVHAERGMSLEKGDQPCAHVFTAEGARRVRPDGRVRGMSEGDVVDHPGCAAFQSHGMRGEEESRDPPEDRALDVHRVPEATVDPGMQEGARGASPGRLGVEEPEEHGVISARQVRQDEDAPGRIREHERDGLPVPFGEQVHELVRGDAEDPVGTVQRDVPVVTGLVREDGPATSGYRELDFERHCDIHRRVCAGQAEVHLETPPGQPEPSGDLDGEDGTPGSAPQAWSGENGLRVGNDVYRAVVRDQAAAAEGAEVPPAEEVFAARADDERDDGARSGLPAGRSGHRRFEHTVRDRHIGGMADRLRGCSRHRRGQACDQPCERADAGAHVTPIRCTERYPTALPRYEAVRPPSMRDGGSASGVRGGDAGRPG